MTDSKRVLMGATTVDIIAKLVDGLAQSDSISFYQAKIELDYLKEQLTSSGPKIAGSPGVPSARGGMPPAPPARGSTPPAPPPMRGAPIPGRGAASLQAGHTGKTASVVDSLALTALLLELEALKKLIADTTKTPAEIMVVLEKIREKMSSALPPEQTMAADRVFVARMDTFKTGYLLKKSKENAEQKIAVFAEAGDLDQIPALLEELINKPKTMPSKQAAVKLENIDFQRDKLIESLTNMRPVASGGDSFLKLYIQDQTFRKQMDSDYSPDGVFSKNNQKNIADFLTRLDGIRTLHTEITKEKNKRINALSSKKDAELEIKKAIEEENTRIQSHPKLQGLNKAISDLRPLLTKIKTEDMKKLSTLSVSVTKEEAQEIISSEKNALAFIDESKSELGENHVDIAVLNKLFDLQKKAESDISKNPSQGAVIVSTLLRDITTGCSQLTAIDTYDAQNVLESRWASIEAKSDFLAAAKENITKSKQAIKEITNKSGSIDLQKLFSYKEGLDAVKQKLNGELSSFSLTSSALGSKATASATALGTNAVSPLEIVKTLQEAKLDFSSEKNKDTDFFKINSDDSSTAAIRNLKLFLSDKSGPGGKKVEPNNEELSKKMSQLIADAKGPTSPLPTIVLMAMASGYIRLKQPGIGKFSMLSTQVDLNNCELVSTKEGAFVSMVQEAYLQMGKTLPTDLTKITTELNTLIRLPGYKTLVTALSIPKNATALLHPENKKYKEIKVEKTAIAKGKLETVAKAMPSSGGSSSPSSLIVLSPNKVTKEVKELELTKSKKEKDLTETKTKITDLKTQQATNRQAFDQSGGTTKLQALEKTQKTIEEGISNTQLEIEAEKRKAELEVLLSVNSGITPETRATLEKTRSTFTTMQKSLTKKDLEIKNNEAKLNRVTSINKLAEETIEKIKSGTTIQEAIKTMAQSSHHEDWSDIQKEFLAQSLLAKNGFKTGQQMTMKNSFKNIHPDPAESVKKLRL